MAHWAIPMIVSHGFELYIYIFLCLLARVRVVYVAKEVASFPGARSINGCGRDRTRVRALQTSRKKERKLLVA